MATNDDEPRLYILMRTDLASMNPGKAVAQGAHAANQCVQEIETSGDVVAIRTLREWQAQTGHGFGTTVTLGVNNTEMQAAVIIAQALKIHAGVTHDPTYPLVDGETVHLIPLDTCAFVFGPKSRCSIVTDNFPLMA